MNIKFNLKGVIYGTILLALVVLGFILVPIMFTEKTQPIDYTMVQKEAMPDKILNMMDKYVGEERALAVKLDDKIYVIVTRDEESNKGIEINKIETLKEEERLVMRVDAIYKDKDKSYPYIVVETNLQELPDKIELNTSIED